MKFIVSFKLKASHINRAKINQTAAYNSIEKLKNLGLIAESRDSSFPYARRFSLTDKGKRIALKLKEIESILQ